MADRTKGSRRSRASRSRGDAGRVFGVLALAFVVLTLVALAVVPQILGRSAEAARRQIIDVLEPARRLATELEFAQARGMSSLQGFLLTGEISLRQQYQVARVREEQVYDELFELAGSMDNLVRARMASTWQQSFRWHFNHTALLAGELSREEFYEFLPAERALFESLLEAAAALQGAIDTEVAVGRARMTYAQNLQFQATVGLIALALAAALAVGVLGSRLRTLYRESESRRGDAVAARREASAVLTATADGILGADLDGRCTMLNDAACELIGFTWREASGRSIHELLRFADEEGHPLDVADSPIQTTRSETAHVRIGECHLLRKDGSAFPASVSVRPMVDGRERRGVVVTITDMTDPRATQEALRRALAGRDEVVAVVSHDLRNPVGTIYAAVGLLMDLPLPPAKQREQMEIIKRSAGHMNRLIQDLLDAATIEAGGLRVEARFEELAPILGEAVEVVRLGLADRDIVLTLELDKDLPPVWGDADRLHQVFTNLLGNAVKFTPAGGEVTVAAHAQDGELVVGVADTGPGIRAEDQERLFDRFWQVGVADRNGAGLGLAIVKGIVDAHGGRVWLDSEIGRGSTFYVALPVAPPPDPEGASSGAEAGG